MERYPPVPLHCVDRGKLTLILDTVLTLTLSNADHKANYKIHKWRGPGKYIIDLWFKILIHDWMQIKEGNALFKVIWHQTQWERKPVATTTWGYSFWLAARDLLQTPSHRQDSTYHWFCYLSHRALAGMGNSSMGPPWGIDPRTHCSKSEHSAMELHLAALLMNN